MDYIFFKHLFFLLGWNVTFPGQVLGDFTHSQHRTLLIIIKIMCVIYVYILCMCYVGTSKTQCLVICCFWKENTYSVVHQQQELELKPSRTTCQSIDTCQKWLMNIQLEATIYTARWVRRVNLPAHFFHVNIPTLKVNHHSGEGQWYWLSVSPYLFHVFLFV